jgi:hypothetical protein
LYNQGTKNQGALAKMKKELLKIASILLLVVSLTACGKAPEPTSVPVDPGVVVIPTTQPGDPCANEYFPVKEKAKYIYNSTGSPSGPYTFTRKITNVRADGFTIDTKFKDQDVLQEWSCKPEGLVPTQLGAADATSILAFERFTDLTAANVTGFVMPPGITSGAEWNYTLDIQGKENVKEGTPATMTGRVSINYIAGKKETVTVPAGTFEAVAIEVNTVIDFNVVAGANTTKLSVDSTYTVWYAPGVGWVKANGYGKLGGQDYVETIELQSYTIP